MPLAKASMVEYRTGFLTAKASARPMTIQLVIIKPTYAPKRSAMSGVNAFKNISKTMVKVEITTMYVTMRT